MVVIIGYGCCSGALVLWNLSPWTSHVYYNKLYYNKLCSAPVVEGRGRRRAFGSR
jgi:hypothetical protein